MRSIRLTTAVAISWLAAISSAQQLFSNNFGRAGANATFDYIVVGGGTGGLAIAYRLAESGKKTVAVVEAGGFYEVENGNTSVVPAYCTTYAQVAPDTAELTPTVDWGFLTTPQRGVNNRTLHYGRGKMLGGSSAENAMIYQRGTIDSFQAWANAVNDSSWTFDRILPYYAKGVNYTTVNPNDTTRAANASMIPLPANPAAWNMSGGPSHVSYPNWASPFSSWVALAMGELGFPVPQDFLSGHLLGSQYAPATVDPHGQVRSSSQESYLNAALTSGRTNLKVYTHTLAKQVIFSRNKTAMGVKVVSGNGNPYVLSARSEVILSAGVFQSPQLLMVSGVGPKNQLRRHNISVIADRPGVGQNMWDHLDFSISYQVNLQGLTASAPSGTQEQVQDYLTNRNGALTQPGVDYIGWEKVPAKNRVSFTSTMESELAQFPADWPEIEYEITESLTTVGSNPDAVYGTIVGVLVAPLSRGDVTIISNDTADLPIINPNWLTSTTDQAVAVQAVKRAREMFATNAIQDVLIGVEVAPGPSAQTDAEILQYIKNTSYQNWHAACTCKMGMTSDPMAVVDSKARVIGVHGVRVVDASSFALLPPGHPQSTVYMAAEKIAADIIQGA